MLEFWNTILFSLSVTGPIFILLALGAWLRQRQSLNDAFIEVGSRLVFTWALPALLFVSIAKTHIDATTNFQLIAFQYGDYRVGVLCECLWRSGVGGSLPVRGNFEHPVQYSRRDHPSSSLTAAATVGSLLTTSLGVMLLQSRGLM